MFTPLAFKHPMITTKRPVFLLITSCKSSPLFSLFSTLPTSKPLHLTPVTESQDENDALFKFFRAHLRPHFTSSDLLRVLNKMLFHPHYKTYIPEVFSWASNKEGFRHDHTTYEWTIRTLASQDRFPQMQDILAHMAKSPCPCSPGIFACPRIEPIYISVINSYSRVCKMEEAIQTFEKMKKVIDGKAPVVAYNIILNGFGKLGQTENAFRFYEDIIKSRVLPDVYTFNILINLVCRVGDLESGFRVLREMRARGCRANVVSYNTLIRGLCKRRRVKEGIELCYEMVGLGCVPSAATYGIVFESLIEKGEQQAAVGLVMEFLRRGVVPVGLDYLNLVEALCKIGRVESALEVVNGLWDAGCVPSVVAGTTLLDGLCKVRKVEETLAVLRRMLECDILPDGVTWNLVLELLCNMGRVAEAEELRLLAMSKGWECDAVTYNILFDGFCKQGRVNEGTNLVNEMLDKDFIHNIGMYNRLMHRLNRSKRIAGRKLDSD